MNRQIDVLGILHKRLNTSFHLKTDEATEDRITK